MPLVPFPAPLPVTDGAGLAAWEEPGALRVADDAVPLSSARSLRPPTCRLAATDGRRLALDCGDGDLRLRELRDDIETTPSGTAAIRFDLRRNFSANNGPIFTIDGLGSRLMGLRFDGKGGTLDLRYDLATGARVGPFLLGPTQLPSLDVESGIVRLCAPLRITRHREKQVYTDEVIHVADVHAFAGSRLLLRHGGEMRLSSCGRKGHRVLGRSAQMQPVLTRRYAAWATIERVFVYGLRSGALRSFAVGKPSLPDRRRVELAGTDRRLWIKDGAGVRVLDL